MNAIATATQAIEAQQIADNVEQFFLYSRITNAQTQKTYKAGIKKFAEYLNSRGISQPTRANIAEYLAALDNATNKKGKPYTNGTKQMALAALRAFFKWCEFCGAYPNITQGIKGYKVDTERKDFLNAAQIRQVLSGITDKRDKAILTLMFCAGLRTVEVIRADVKDLAADRIYIQGKGHAEKDAIIRIMPECRAVIAEYLNERGAADPNDPLFACKSNNNKHGRLTTVAISAMCKKYFRAAGYDSERLTAHCTRHSAITLMLECGATLQEAQNFARHRNIQTTLVYAHNLDAMKNRGAAMIAAQIF